MEKEAWKTDILRSLEGMRRAEPDPALYGSIQASIGESAEVRSPQMVYRPYVALAAACLLLLVAVNLYALQQQYAKQPRATPAVYESLDNAHFDLYQ